MRRAAGILRVVGSLAWGAAGCQQTDMKLMEKAEVLAVSTARPLRVLLFGHIPPYGAGLAHPALAAWIEAHFEAQAEQQIDLRLRFADTYALTASSPELTGPESYDVIELDLAVLPALAASFAPWAGVDPRRFVPAGVAAGEATQGLLWPTYLCSHVIYARDAQVADARDLTDLTRTLRRRAPGGKTALAGDLFGDGMLSGLYADAWYDRTAGTQPRPSAIEPEVIADLRQLVRLCGTSSSDNPCLNDSYDLTKERLGGIEALVRGDAAGWLGFSEHAHYMLRAGITADALQVVSAPLGPDSHPALFVDGLVRNRRCTGTCQRDATELAAFLTSAQVQAVIARGEDDDARGTPRYLMMAGRAFWELPAVTRDPLYAQLRPIAFTPSILPSLDAPEAALRARLSESEPTAMPR